MAPTGMRDPFVQVFGQNRSGAPRSESSLSTATDTQIVTGMLEELHIGHGCHASRPLRVIYETKPYDYVFCAVALPAHEGVGSGRSARDDYLLTGYYPSNANRSDPLESYRWIPTQHLINELELIQGMTSRGELAIGRQRVADAFMQYYQEFRVTFPVRDMSSSIDPGIAAWNRLQAQEARRPDPSRPGEKEVSNVLYHVPKRRTQQSLSDFYLENLNPYVNRCIRIVAAYEEPTLNTTAPRSTNVEPLILQLLWNSSFGIEGGSRSSPFTDVYKIAWDQSWFANLKRDANTMLHSRNSTPDPPIPDASEWSYTDWQKQVFLRLATQFRALWEAATRNSHLATATAIVEDDCRKAYSLFDMPTRFTGPEVVERVIRSVRLVTDLHDAGFQNKTLALNRSLQREMFSVVISRLKRQSAMHSLARMLQQAARDVLGADLTPPRPTEGRMSYAAINDSSAMYLDAFPDAINALQCSTTDVVELLQSLTLQLRAAEDEVHRLAIRVGQNQLTDTDREKVLEVDASQRLEDSNSAEPSGAAGTRKASFRDELQKEVRLVQDSQSAQIEELEKKFKLLGETVRGNLATAPSQSIANMSPYTMHMPPWPFPYHAGMYPQPHSGMMPALMGPPNHAHPALLEDNHSNSRGQSDPLMIATTRSQARSPTPSTANTRAEAGRSGDRSGAHDSEGSSARRGEGKLGDPTPFGFIVRKFPINKFENLRAEDQRMLRSKGIDGEDNHTYRQRMGPCIACGAKGHPVGWCPGLFARGSDGSKLRESVRAAKVASVHWPEEEPTMSVTTLVQMMGGPSSDVERLYLNCASCIAVDDEEDDPEQRLSFIVKDEPEGLLIAPLLIQLETVASSFRGGSPAK